MYVFCTLHQVMTSPHEVTLVLYHPSKVQSRKQRAKHGRFCTPGGFLGIIYCAKLLQLRVVVVGVYEPLKHGGI